MAVESVDKVRDNGTGIPPDVKEKMFCCCENRIRGRRDQFKSNVRFWPKADMASCTAHVCFWG